MSKEKHDSLTEEIRGMKWYGDNTAAVVVSVQEWIIDRIAEHEAERIEKIKAMLVTTEYTSEYEDGWNDAIDEVMKLLGTSRMLLPKSSEKFLPWQIGSRKH